MIHRLLVPGVASHGGVHISGQFAVLSIDTLRDFNAETRELTYARIRNASPGVCLTPQLTLNFDGFDFSIFRDALQVLCDYREVSEGIVSGLEAEVARVIAESTQSTL